MAWINEDREGRLANIRCFLLDLDGTVYLEDSWIEGAVDFLRRIEATGRRYLFLTNNSSRGREDYVRKFQTMGFPVDKEKIIASGEVTAAYVKRRYPGKHVFLLGNPSLQAEFSRWGIPLGGEEAEVLVTGFDTTLTYASLATACSLAGRPLHCHTSGYQLPRKGRLYPGYRGHRSLYRRLFRPAPGYHSGQAPPGDH